MAKFLIALLLGAAVAIADIHGSPVLTAIDWDAASARVDAIQVHAINENFAKLIAVAGKDNPHACYPGNPGVCFPKVVNVHQAKWIRVSIRNMEFQIISQSLEPEFVSLSVENVHRELDILLNEELPLYLAQLSEPAVKKIKIYFDKAHAALDLYESELNSILMKGK